MGIFSKQIQPLTIDQIGEIVKSFYQNEKTGFPEMDQEALLGSPYWTLIQMLDNYLMSKYNLKFYHDIQSSYPSKNYSLPAKPVDSTEFNANLFHLLLIMRATADEKMIKHLVATGRKKATKFAPKEKRDADITMQEFVHCFIASLQEYEILSNPNLTEADEPIIPELLTEVKQDNTTLIHYYFDARPAVSRKIEDQLK